MRDFKIPRPGRKPSVPDWFPLVNDETVKFTKYHETPLGYLYKDSVGAITTGIGFNVDANPKKAYDLGMYWKEPDRTPGKRRASVQDIQQAYDKIRPIPTGYKAEFFNPLKNDQFSKILMRDEDMEYHVRQKLNQSEQELKRKIPNFNGFPYAARKALLDMQYNMGDKKFRHKYINSKGEEKGWPELYNAIDERNWAAAAERSKRDVGDERNQAIREMFLEAERDVRNGRYPLR